MVDQSDPISAIGIKRLPRDGGQRSIRMQRPWTALLCGAFLLTLLASCTVGPDFQKPEPNMPDQWHAPLPEAPPAAEVALAHWWTAFNDPLLDSLIQRAETSNLDLKLAEARIRQARAVRGVVAGALGPALDASGSYSRSRIPVSSSSQTGRSVDVTADDYQAGFDAFWEIDIFGGRRRALEQSNADLLAAVENMRYVQVTLMAEVARNYLLLRSYQQQLAITQKNLAAQTHSAQLTRQRFEGGFVSGLDVANADALSATTAAQIPLLEAAAQQTIYGLSVLLGDAPAALAQELSPLGLIPAAPPAVPLKVPSELLRRRPDIRQAEAQIHSATARIGVAVADLYPKFTISGAAGYRATDFSNLMDWSSRFWSFGPSVSWPLFQSGSLRANVEAQKALQEQEVIIYRQTVLGALQEVENALVAAAKEQAHRAALVMAVAANRKAVGLAETLYTQGLTDFINVLQAERALYETENALVQSSATLSTNLVALYKALGGGWDMAPMESAAADLQTPNTK